MQGKKGRVLRQNLNSLARELFIFTFKYIRLTGCRPRLKVAKSCFLAWELDRAGRSKSSLRSHEKDTPFQGHQESWDKLWKQIQDFVEKLLWSHGARKIVGSISLKLVFKTEVHESQAFHRASADVKRTLDFNWQKGEFSQGWHQANKQLKDFLTQDYFLFERKIFFL